MAQPPDESKSKTLLDPELNPILNPLLAAHMGRWAEVYFTSPPEKREQAVADLVRELSQHSGSAEVLAVAEKVKPIEHQEVADPNPPSNAGKKLAPPVEAVENPVIVCPSCGHLNVGQRFCAMCGNPLASKISIGKPHLVPGFGASRSNKQESSHRSASDAESDDPSLPRQSMKLVDQYPDDNYSFDQSSPSADIQYADRPSPVADFAEDENSSQTFATPQPNLESFPAYESDTPEAADFEPDASEGPSEDQTENSANRAKFTLPSYETESDYESESRPQRNRLYIGAVVAITLALLVYVTWRGNSASGGHTVVPELPKATSEAAPSVGNDTTDAAKPRQATPSQSATPTLPPAHSNFKQTTSTPRTGIAEQNRKSQVRLATQVSNAMTSQPSPGPANQGGAEELATAEKYLKSGPGGAQQAIGWLWKAVAKQNAAATMVLSDLYLRGEGISKNCDQARLLLDAAARKGESAAAERLRNLQSYGCQ